MVKKRSSSRRNQMTGPLGNVWVGRILVHMFLVECIRMEFIWKIYLIHPHIICKFNRNLDIIYFPSVHRIPLRWYSFFGWTFQSAVQNRIWSNEHFVGKVSWNATLNFKIIFNGVIVDIMVLHLVQMCAQRWLRFYIFIPTLVEKFEVAS